MTFEKFENWIKKNKYLSIILIFAFIAGVILQIGDFVNKTEQLLSTESYKILDINLDYATVTSEFIEEGFAMDNNLFLIKLIESKKEKLFEEIKSSPNDIWLIRISGTTPIGSRWIGGVAEASSFSIGLGTDSWENLLIHFPKSETLTGWNSFYDGVSTADSNYFELRGFFRFVYFRDKGDRMNQYKLQVVEPDSELAKSSIEILETDSKRNEYVMNQ
ncbi:hypothetical protein MAR621_03291 [Maribacter dokdonensis]|uniref:hypothetical protein n=1 Tax=Maribacter dokdonensis TaxID=320912 RepID=UPI001B15B07E|nr:hypothetical protein [Maribacter dokdonensis]CAG2533014.1 hypothetical protein MAR621_03291 [Maribacter dokdonensis]|tara:strand:- start:27 stop:680 length:654 start_codon:yes stop_codon:yes gene_type:complete